MDSPLLQGGELSDELVLREEFDNLLAQVLGGEWPHKRSLPFDLDGGIDDGLLLHPMCGCVLLLRRTGWLTD